MAIGGFVHWSLFLNTTVKDKLTSREGAKQKECKLSLSTSWLMYVGSRTLNSSLLGSTQVKLRFKLKTFRGRPEMGTNILHKLASAHNTSSPLPRYKQHSGICSLNFNPALEKWRESAGDMNLISRKSTLTPLNWELLSKYPYKGIRFRFDSKSHLPWAERRVRGMWKGWAVWVCWQRLRRQQQVHQSLCRVPLLLAAPTAEHHS